MEFPTHLGAGWASEHVGPAGMVGLYSTGMMKTLPLRGLSLISALKDQRNLEGTRTCGELGGEGGTVFQEEEPVCKSLRVGSRAETNLRELHVPTPWDEKSAQ